MLVTGPKREKSGGQEEAINECVAQRLHFFRCGHINILWEESRLTRSRKPGMARSPAQEESNKSVQDAADKDNYHTTYARAVKLSLIATITGGNRHIVSSKYPPRLNWGYSRAAAFLADLKPNQVHWPVRKLPGDIINSIRSQNRGKANGLFMDSLDVFIRLVKQEDADASNAIRLLFK